MDARHGKLAAGLSAAWEAELLSAQRLAELAERMEAPAARARLWLLAAFCRAHAARLLARLASMGRGPLPVPSELQEDEVEPVEDVLEREARRALHGGARYTQLAAQARAQGDVSSAWVCELNRAEEEERAAELRAVRMALIATPWLPPSLEASPL